MCCAVYVRGPLVCKILVNVQISSHTDPQPRPPVGTHVARATASVGTHVGSLQSEMRDSVARDATPESAASRSRHRRSQTAQDSTHEAHDDEQHGSTAARTIARRSRRRRAAPLREHLERALARPPPDESAEPPQEVEQLGQRKPRPQGPARHARRCGSARRWPEASRSSQRTNGRACGHALERHLVSRFAAGAAFERVRNDARPTSTASAQRSRALATSKGARHRV